MDRFLDATVELLAEKPFHELTVTEIIERSGKTVGSFYARFDDKDGVLRALRERAEIEVRELIVTFGDLAHWKDATLAEIVHTFVGTLVRAYRASGPVFQATSAKAAVDPEFREYRATNFRFGAEVFTRLVLDHRKEIRHPRPERVVDLAFQALVGVLDQDLLFGGLGTTRAATDEQLVDELAELFLRAVGAIRP